MLQKVPNYISMVLRLARRDHLPDYPYIGSWYLRILRNASTG